jgi:hypothetical protein
MIDELERKLIRLALDPAAQPGEIANCARMLIHHWRKRGVSAEEIFGTNGGQLPPWAPDYGLCVMPFGKYKRKQFKDISPRYFKEWILPWLKSKPADDKYAEANARLIDEIEHFLEQ